MKCAVLTETKGIWEELSKSNRFSQVHFVRPETPDQIASVVADAEIILAGKYFQ
jgi:hypothetical protein